MGMTTLNRPAGHYGLSLILGGGEVSMWDLAGIYASLARVLNHQYDYSGRYNPLDYHPPRYLAGAWTDDEDLPGSGNHRSEEHTSELQSLMRNSYAVFCL